MLTRGFFLNDIASTAINIQNCDLLLLCSLHLRRVCDHVMKTLYRMSYAPITVMPYPPRLVVDGDFEGGLTPAACLWEGHLPYMVSFYCTFAHTCSDFDERDCPCRKELDNCPVQIS